MLRLACVHHVTGNSPGKDELRAIHSACQEFESKIRSESKFINGCYVFLKSLILAQMMAQSEELAHAYLKKTMLAITKSPQLQLRFVEKMAQLSCVGVKDVLALCKQYAVVVGSESSLFKEILRRNEEQRQKERKNSKLVEEAVDIFEAMLAQDAFKSSQDAWLDYYKFLSSTHGKEQEAKRVLQRALGLCESKERLLSAH